jgi:hypothetical protein
MTIQDIRRANLRTAMGDMSTAEFARKVETNPDYLSQIFSQKTKANVGSKLARRIEAVQGLPKGWMDERHPDQLSPPLEAEQLIADYLALPHGLQKHLRRKAAELRWYADQLPPFLRAALVPPSEDHESYRQWERDMEADMALRKRQAATPSANEPRAPYDAGTKSARNATRKSTKKM